MKLRKAPEMLCVAATVAAVLSTFSVGAISAHAASPATQQERADCLAGRTAEDQKTCLKEAGAAAQSTGKRGLSTPTPEQVAANQRKRCDPLKGDDRAACLKRAAGVDTAVSGSVAAGGELKTTTTVVPGTPPDVHPETMPPTAAGPGSLPTPPAPQPNN
jgi:hypothetical protein